MQPTSQLAAAYAAPQRLVLHCGSLCWALQRTATEWVLAAATVALPLGTLLTRCAGRMPIKSDITQAPAGLEFLWLRLRSRDLLGGLFEAPQLRVFWAQLRRALPLRAAVVTEHCPQRWGWRVTWLRLVMRPTVILPALLYPWQGTALYDRNQFLLIALWAVATQPLGSMLVTAADEGSGTRADPWWGYGCVSVPDDVAFALLALKENKKV